MIRRIVHMFFVPELRTQFLDLFEETKSSIRNFPGCQSLELLENPLDPTELSTLSTWDSVDALNHYRESELFLNTWAQTRILFRSKAQASSFLIRSIAI